MNNPNSVASIKYSGQCVLKAWTICRLRWFGSSRDTMNVSIGGIFIRSRRLSNTLVLLELVSSIFVVAHRREPQLVVDVMRRFSVNTHVA